MKATMPKVPGDDGDEDLMEDSDDEIDSSFYRDIDSDDDDIGGSEDESEGEDLDDDDALALVEGSDNEDLISLDGDMPGGLIEYDGSDASENEDEDEWGGIDGDEETKSRSKKRKREHAGRDARKKLRSLPTFASYEDYAKMIEETPEDNI